MKKIILWIKKRYLWILGAISSGMITILLIILKIKNAQNRDLRRGKVYVDTSKKQLENSGKAGEVKGKDAVLSEQEKQVEASLKKDEEALNETGKKTDRSSSEIADILNSAYGKPKD
jgi:hypothetical protein